MTWYNGSHTMMSKPIKILELHHPNFQFLILNNIVDVHVFAPGLLQGVHLRKEN